MAIINQSKNFIFVHVPKAAGTSVTSSLSQYTTYKDLEIGGTHFGELVQPAYQRRFRLGKHTPASGIRDVIGLEDWNRMFTFSIVRNPYDRVISTYNFLKQWAGTPVEVQDYLAKFENVNEYVLSDIWDEMDGPDFIFKPQTFWLTDKQDRKKVIVDFVGKLESLDEDIAYVKSQIEGKNVPPVVSPLLNTSKGGASLSDQAIDKINRYYQRDFEFWNYEKIQ